MVHPTDLASDLCSGDRAISRSVTGAFLSPVRLHQLKWTSVCQLHVAQVFENHASHLQRLNATPALCQPAGQGCTCRSIFRLALMSRTINRLTAARGPLAPERPSLE